jgi:hypothetical protein
MRNVLITIYSYFNFFSAIPTTANLTQSDNANTIFKDLRDATFEMRLDDDDEFDLSSTKS